MTIINSKTIARIAAIQVVYQITMNNSMSNIHEIIYNVTNYYNGNDVIEDLEVKNASLKIKLHKSFFEELCNSIKSNLEKIDDTIKIFLSEEWPFDNLHINLKAILRTGVNELIFFPEIPSKVIVNEYTNIASDMLKTQEVGFVNSILDTINKEIRKNAS